MNKTGTIECLEISDFGPGLQNPANAAKAAEILMRNTENLQIDILCDEINDESELIRNLHQLSQFKEKLNKNLRIRAIAPKKINDRQINKLQSMKIEPINDSIPSGPADEWWHAHRQKSTDDSIQFLTVSRDEPEITERITEMEKTGSLSILISPKLINLCKSEDAEKLIKSINRYADFFKKRILQGATPSIINSNRLLLMIRQFNTGNPLTLKNRCNDTNRRILLDKNGVFRTCRHFETGPAWDLGNIKTGPANGKRMNLYRYGLVMRNLCRKCTARFYCAGPCISAASKFAESAQFPMGYQCLFQKLHTEAMEYIYHSLNAENPDALEKSLKTCEKLSLGINEK